MQLIALSQGQFAKVDDADFEWLNQWKWYAHFSPIVGTFYAIRADYSSGKGVTIQMARLILGLVDPKIKADHEDHDTLNNQRYNLREANASQSQANRDYKKANGFKGVGWDSQKNKWRARVCFGRKSTHVGFFDTPEAAYEAYNKKALEIHKEFFRK